MELFRQSESARRSSPFINSAAKRRRVTASGSRAAKKQGNIPAAYWERRTRRLLMRSWLTSPAAGFFLCKKTSFFHRIKLFDRRRAVGQHYPTACRYSKNCFKSSSTVPMPAIPKRSTSTWVTFGLRNAGSVGPRWIFFTPRYSRASSTMTAFCSYQAIL